MPRIPLKRADNCTIGISGFSNQVGLFRLPEISISEDIMHLGLPSGEISESDLRRITPPSPSRSNASLCQPASQLATSLHHRHHHASHALSHLLCLLLLLSYRLTDTVFDG